MFTKKDVQNYIKEANSKMLGKTNRTIVFCRVNNDQHIDPEAAEEDKQETPSLARLLPLINNMQPAVFLERVREELTVTSFADFLDKFQPGFYYRVVPGGTSPEDTDTRLQFGLEGGAGWKKVRITTDHPYVKSLQNMVKSRVRQGLPSYRVDVGASLLTLQPRNQRNQMRKIAEDLQARYQLVALQAKRDPGSLETRRAKALYDTTARDFAGALEDSLRVLPTVVYGLEQTGKEIRRQPAGSVGVDDTIYQIEFGTNAKAIATPRATPGINAPASDKPEALEGPKDKAAGIEAPSDGQVAAIDAPTTNAADATSDTSVAEADKTGAASDTGVAVGDTAPTAVVEGAENKAVKEAESKGVKSIVNALDGLREDRQKVASKELATVSPSEQYAVVLSRFIDGAVNNGHVPEMMGNMLAVVLQDPKALALKNPDITEIDQYHDTFLEMYNTALEDFLKEVTPLFEQVMGIYLLFNEFSRDVRIDDAMKPEVIVANAYLPDLYLTRPEELTRFFAISNSQAANQFRDAISFAVVPRVEAFVRQRPAAKPKASAISVDDDLFAEIEAAQQANATKDTAESYDAVTFVDELLSLVDAGYKYGFQVLFSPEDKVIAGDATRETYEQLRNNYALETVVNSDSADAAILCVPDFVLVPPDGVLITGRTADGKKEVGAKVPQLLIRSCFVAAGRLMANDLPAYVEHKLTQHKRSTSMVRKEVPGIGIDLSANPYLGETDLPTDHFLDDDVMAAMLDSSMPFAAFTHVTGRLAALTIPRTMRRINNPDGTQRYRLLHLFRQQQYLIRLLRAAHELSLGGAFPDEEEEAVDLIQTGINWIITFSGWHNPKELVNSFPSALMTDQPFTIERAEGNTFNMSFGFKQGRIGELKIQF